MIVNEEPQAGAPVVMPGVPTPQVISDQLGGAIPAQAVNTSDGLSVWVRDDAAALRFNVVGATLISSHDGIMHMISGPCIIAARDPGNAALSRPLTAAEALVLQRDAMAFYDVLVCGVRELPGDPLRAQAIRELAEHLCEAYQQRGGHVERYDPVARLFWDLGIEVHAEDVETLFARLYAARPYNVAQ